MRRGLLPLARHQDRCQTRLRRPFHIVSQTVPDMKRLRRLHGMLFERELKNLRGRLGRVGQTGDGDRVEQLGDA